ncbi:MAG: hypothetical protein ACJA1L_002099 [Paracoccaceae bacterium]|jgi:hypothetical protein
MRRGIFVADYEITLKRAVLALAAGAVLGTPLRMSMAAGWVLLVGPGWPDGMSSDETSQHLTWFAGRVIETLPSAIFVSLSLLCLYGVPILYGLHKLRLRGWGAMACGGAVWAVLSMAAMSIVFGAGAAFGSMDMLSVPLMVLGGIVTFAIIWAVAYRRPAAPG